MTKERVGKIIEDSKQGKIVWSNREGLSCYTSSYNPHSYIICGYELDDGSFEIAFNERDGFGLITGEVLEYQVGHPLFDKLEELYEVVFTTAETVTQ